MSATRGGNHEDFERRTLMLIRASCFGLLLLVFCCAAAVCVAGPQATANVSAAAPYDLEALYRQAKQACPSGGLVCLEPQFQSVTAKHGPRAAIELFTLLHDRGIVAANVDGHHVVHHVGHETAMVFGATAEALAMCPDSYNYGCMHGFFQHALGMGGISDFTAAKICQDLQKPSISLKTVQSCYHGFGHGVMVSSDYNLGQALGRCDKLESPVFQQDCWQGVFMENVDSAIEGKWQQHGFSREDSLAPCDTVDGKHQVQCFINQSAWMMKVLHNDLGAGAQACLKAPTTAAAPCLESLGLLTTNPAWQDRLLPAAPAKAGLLENGWTLCRKFPDSNVGDCVVAGLDNLLNSGLADAKDGQAFCDTVDESYRARCSERIHDDLRYLTPQSIKKPEPASTHESSEQ